ncbi:MAG: McrC family protein [Arcobacteraceae bacterium]|jgi:5-methylcytosine-specific restriction enzyme subunit McrC|nr:McrC family protein [Arcobacteraceae bacterium]
MILKEFEFLQCKIEEDKNYIKSDTFEAIEKFVLENETMQYLKITTKKGFGKVLQAQNYVGVIQTKDGTTIEILPKIQNVDEEKSKEILIKMLGTLKNSPFKHFNTANLKASKLPLLEIFISMFLEELSKLIQKGIKSDYISKEENLKFLKGKLKISEQIKQNSIHKERFFVEYQEFSSDRIENRLIKTTLQYLYKKSKSNKNQQRIREFLFVFDEIEVSHTIKTDFLQIKLNRQMRDYEQVLLWCKIFLLENSFSPYKGDTIAFALLFDMNLLFESYVYDYLRKNGKFENIKNQDKKHHLAYENGSGKFALKPDIVVDGGEIIIDTKWKILSVDKSNQGISQSDMYQLYAYGTKYRKCKKMYLVYPYDRMVTTGIYDYFKDDTSTDIKKDLQLEVQFFDILNSKFQDDNFLNKTI